MEDWRNDLTWNAISYAVTAAVAVLILVSLYFFVPDLKRRWLPLVRLRPGAWTGADVFLAFCILMGFQQITVDLLQKIGFFAPLLGAPPADNATEAQRLVFSLRCLVISSPLNLTLLVGVCVAMMFARSGSRPHHYGLTWSLWPSNLTLGGVAFLLSRPVVLGIFALALLIYPPRVDPFRELSKQDLPWWEWLLFAFQTTAAAPILEEIFFRGILQGWLRRATLLGHVTFLFLTSMAMIVISSSDIAKFDEEAKEWVVQAGPIVFAILIVGGYGAALFLLARRFLVSDDELRNWRPLPGEMPLNGSFGSEESARTAREQLRAGYDGKVLDWQNRNAWLAIFGSAMLFAAVHPWPHMIALFPFGLLLGWVAQRTQSLLSSIALHSLFNFSTFIALYGSVVAPF